MLLNFSPSISIFVRTTERHTRKGANVRTKPGIGGISIKTSTKDVLASNVLVFKQLRY